jgi:hypothetical protein
LGDAISPCDRGTIRCRSPERSFDVGERWFGARIVRQHHAHGEIGRQASGGEQRGREIVDAGSRCACSDLRRVDVGLTHQVRRRGEFDHDQVLVTEAAELVVEQLAGGQLESHVGVASLPSSDSMSARASSIVP